MRKNTSKGKGFEFSRQSDRKSEEFSDQRGKNILEKLTKQHPKHAKAFKRASKILRGKPNYTSALPAVAETIVDGKINVFISYQFATDAKAARQIAKIFRKFSKGSLDVIYAEEFTEKIPGQDYREKIQEAITEAHLFIFLLSDSKRISDWGMYETGMFRASMISKYSHRLICIHHPDAMLPPQIHEYQSVKATLPDLKSFLQGLFCKANPLPGWEKLSPEIDEKTIKSSAKKISKAFNAPNIPIDFNHWVKLKVCDPVNLRDWKDLLDCDIVMDSGTPELFGKLKAPGKWGKLIDNVVEMNTTDTWLKELYAVIVKAVKGNIARPISGTFECFSGGRVMRPVLHSMEHDGGGGDFYFNLYFLDDLFSAHRRNITAGLESLLITVRAGHRIRWEVLERFKNVKWDVEKMAICSTAFSRIEREEEFFGKLDVEELCTYYDQESRKKVRRIIKRWRKLKGYRPIAGRNRGGKLDQAFREKDIGGVDVLMKECRNLINEFLELTYPVLVKVTIA